MKKFEYMLADFSQRRLRHLNGVEVENFEEMKWPLFLSSFRDPVSAKGTYITDFLSKAGEDGWEAVSIYGQFTETILFKRELKG